MCIGLDSVCAFNCIYCLKRCKSRQFIRSWSLNRNKSWTDIIAWTSSTSWVYFGEDRWRSLDAVAINICFREPRGDFKHFVLLPEIIKKNRLWLRFQKNSLYFLFFIHYHSQVDKEGDRLPTEENREEAREGDNGMINNKSIKNKSK